MTIPRPSAERSFNASPDSASPPVDGRLRIALIYDRLYPYEIGGFERFYRDLAERLAAHHDVTFLTRTQWAPKQRPDLPAGVRLVAFDCGRQVYTPSGRRRILPTLRFGMSVLVHLLRNRKRYDVVETGSFPFFSALAAMLVQSLKGPEVVTDWIEVWSDDYWRQYLGPFGGRVGAGVQRLCIRLTRHAFTFSHLTAELLRQHGYSGQLVILKGMLDSPGPAPLRLERDPLVVFAGRHIREKHADAIPAAISLARRQIADLQALVFGEGPARAKLLAEVTRLHLENIVSCPGFVPWDEVDRAMRRAMCLILPSEREGYGAVVMEAIARGTPAIVVRAPYNAATGLIVENVNGFIAPSIGAYDLSAQIVKVHQEGRDLLLRTHQWFYEHAQEVSIDASVKSVEQTYRTITRSPDGASSDQA
jgi:glycosyltransferase involved in cell wall biosynthesis